MLKTAFRFTRSAASSNRTFQSYKKPAFVLAFFWPMLLAAQLKALRPDPWKLGLLFAGALCVIPFLQPRHDTPIRAFYDEWLAFAFGMAAIGSISILGTKSLSRIPALSVCLVLFGLSLFVRAFVADSAYPQSALIWGLYAIFAALVAILGFELATHFGRERVCDFLAASMLAGAFANGAAAIFQVVGIPPPLEFVIANLHGTRAIGNIGQANLYANYIALGEASLIYLYSRDKIRGGWAMSGGIFLVSCAALAASRSSILYAMTFATLAFAASTVFKSGLAVKLFKAAVIVAVSVMVAQWLVPVTMNALGFRIEGGFQRDAALDADPLTDQALNLRLIVWGIAARQFIGAPWIGVGPDEFAGAAFESGLPIELSGDLVWTSPHDLILQLLAETGLLGAALVGAGVLAWLRRSSAEFVNCATPVTWWIFACTGVEMIHALLEYPLSYAHFLAVTALIMGVGSTGGLSLRPMFTRTAAALTAVAGAILLTFHVADYFKFDRASPVSAGRSLAAESDLARDRASLTALSDTLLAPRSERWLFLAYPVDSTDLDNKLAVGERVLRLWPSREVVVRQSIFLALAGRDSEALKLFERGLRTFSNRTALITRSLDSAPHKARDLLQPALQRRLRS